MEQITEKESLLLQCLATTSFMAELNNDNFLSSDYFEKMKFGNEDIKQILKQSGMGNPAALQMMLYALLVIPKEVLSSNDYHRLEAEMQSINSKIDQIVETESISYYEKDKDKIDYLYHMRNAIAHSKCSYTRRNDRYFVTFNDKNIRKENERCYIVIECRKVGNILMDLQRLILKFYKSNHKS